MKLGAIPHMVARRIVTGHFDRACGDIDAYAGCPRQFMEQGNEQTARSGAQIENAQAIAGMTPVFQRDEGGGDYGFAIGTRHKGFGHQGEGQAPKFPFAKNPRHRHAGKALLDVGSELLSRLGANRFPRATNQIGVNDTGSIQHQEACIPLGGFDADGAEGLAKMF